MIHLINHLTITTSARPKCVLLSPQSSGVLGTCWNAPCAWPKDSAHCARVAHLRRFPITLWLRSHHWRHCDRVFCARAVCLLYTCARARIVVCEVKDPVIRVRAPCAAHDSIITITYTSYKYAQTRSASERDATECTHHAHTRKQKNIAQQNSSNARKCRASSSAVRPLRVMAFCAARCTSPSHTGSTHARTGSARSPAPDRMS